MAGDWIPMRTDLWDCPEVVRILSAICPQSVRTVSERVRRKAEIVGALYRTWSLFDTHSDDGILRGYDASSLDELVGIDGWSANLQHVGWLLIGQDSLEMPRFEAYLSQSAKRRHKDNKRKATTRKKVSAKRPKNVRSGADKMRTTEEKRREEKSTRKRETSSLQKEGVVVESAELMTASFDKDLQKVIHEIADLYPLPVTKTEVRRALIEHEAQGQAQTIKQAASHLATIATNADRKYLPGFSKFVADGIYELDVGAMRARYERNGNANPAVPF